VYAIFRHGEKQYRVEENDILKVDYFDASPGDMLEFNDILLVKDGDKIAIGTPSVEGAKVEAEILENGKDKKVLVFKKKRRKQYKKMLGHRQKYTKILIKKINYNFN